MRFLANAGVSPKTVDFLKQLGHEAVHVVFDAVYRAGDSELEVVPQGTLVERIRAAGAGLGAFFTPTAYGTMLAAREGGARDPRLPLPFGGLLIVTT